jgi:hypothetical protein
VRDWPKIALADEHFLVADELDKRCGPVWYSDSIRSNNPKGLHRLKDLVPGAFPSQEFLARTLAEYAVSNRRSEAWDDIPHRAKERYHQAQDQKNGIQRLVKEAKTDWIAWEACRLYLEGKSELVMLDDGTWGKRKRPIPEPVMELMQTHFEGQIPRPTPSKPGRSREENVSYYGAIQLAVWMACESALNPTARNGKPSGSAIVAAILGLPVPTVNGIWSKRKSKPSGTPRNVY